MKKLDPFERNSLLVYGTIGFVMIILYYMVPASKPVIDKLLIPYIIAGPVIGAVCNSRKKKKKNL